MASRLSRAHLLEHPSRRKLYAAICGRPGIAFLDLLAHLRADPAFEARAGNGMLTHHLRHLERHHLIVSHKVGQFRRYFQKGGTHGRASAQIALLRTPPISLLARAVLANPGRNQGETVRLLRGSLACSRQNVAYNLKRLEERGLIAIQVDGCQKRYWPTAELERLEAFLPASSDSPAPGSPLKLTPALPPEAQP